MFTKPDEHRFYVSVEYIDIEGVDKGGARIGYAVDRVIDLSGVVQSDEYFDVFSAGVDLRFYLLRQGMGFPVSVGGVLGYSRSFVSNSSNVSKETRGNDLFVGGSVYGAFSIDNDMMVTVGAESVYYAEITTEIRRVKSTNYTDGILVRGFLGVRTELNENIFMFIPVSAGIKVEDSRKSLYLILSIGFSFRN